MAEAVETVLCFDFTGFDCCVGSIKEGFDKDFLVSLKY